MPKMALTIIHNLANEEPKSPTQKRFEVLIKHFNVTVYGISQQLGCTQNRIWRAMHKQKGIDSELLEGISEIFPEANMDWLITGRGSMLHGGDTMAIQDQRDNYGIANEGVKLVSKHQYAEYCQHHGRPDFISALPSLDSSIIDPGAFRDFEMSGPQMQHPQSGGIQESDIIRAQFIPKAQHAQVLQPGSIIVAVLADNIIIGQISENSKGKISIEYWNPLYPSIKIPITSIRQLWSYRSLRTTRDWSKLHPKSP